MGEKVYCFLCYGLKGFDLFNSVLLWSQWKHTHMHIFALWLLLSLQLHLPWPLDPTILSAFIFLCLPFFKYPQQYCLLLASAHLSAALCYGMVCYGAVQAVHQSCRDMMTRLHIPYSICSWHSCITFALLTPSLSAFALSSSHSHCFAFPSFGSSGFSFFLSFYF